MRLPDHMILEMRRLHECLGMSTQEVEDHFRIVYFWSLNKKAVQGILDYDTRRHLVPDRERKIPYAQDQDPGPPKVVRKSNPSRISMCSRAENRLLLP